MDLTTERYREIVPCSKARHFWEWVVKLSDWAVMDQPRERLFRTGARSLSDAELIALCLGTGGAGEDAVSLGRRLLAEHGGIAGLLHAPPRRLLTSRGLGHARVALLKSIVELHARQAEAPLRQSTAFTDVSAAGAFVSARIGYREREVFGCLFLDSRHRLLGWDELFLGSINRAHVHAREVLRRAMEYNAAAVVLAHNHPSGNAEPSQADLHITRELEGLLEKVDIRVLDHLVVAGSGWTSLAARGLISRQPG